MQANQKQNESQNSIIIKENPPPNVNQNHNYACIENNIGTSLCTCKECKKNGIMCEKEQCPCHEPHKQHHTTNLKRFFNKLITNDQQNYIEAIKNLELISMYLEPMIKKIEIQKKLYESNEIKPIQQKVNQLTGQYVDELIQKIEKRQNNKSQRAYSNSKEVAIFTKDFLQKIVTMIKNFETPLFGFRVVYIESKIIKFNDANALNGIVQDRLKVKYFKAQPLFKFSCDPNTNYLNLSKAKNLIQNCEGKRNLFVILMCISGNLTSLQAIDASIDYINSGIILKDQSKQRRLLFGFIPIKIQNREKLSQQQQQILNKKGFTGAFSYLTDYSQFQHNKYTYFQRILPISHDKIKECSWKKRIQNEKLKISINFGDFRIEYNQNKKEKEDYFYYYVSDAFEPYFKSEQIQQVGFLKGRQKKRIVFAEFYHIIENQII